MLSPKPRYFGPRRVEGVPVARPGAGGRSALERATERLLSRSPSPRQVEVPRDRFRGLHRLAKTETGEPACTACLACAAVCPTRAIRLAVLAHDSAQARPAELARFELDALACIGCYLCVEACDDDALFMDTRAMAPPVDRPSALSYDTETLLARESDRQLVRYSRPSFESFNPRHSDPT
jgi:NADH-quinone oxidoreductase subunit I